MIHYYNIYSFYKATTGQADSYFNRTTVENLSWIRYKESCIKVNTEQHGGHANSLHVGPSNWKVELTHKVTAQRKMLNCLFTTYLPPQKEK